MFLFLSKLLPLVLYPLGLASLLLLVALFLLWKRSRLAILPISLALVVLLVSSSGWFADWIVRSLEWQHIPSTPLPQAEAIVVLGGATKSNLPPRPWIEVSDEGDRVLYAAKLYREGKAPRVILSGGRIHWRGSGTPESADMAELMGTMGVPATAILQDPTSLNTRENAVNVKKILDSQGIRQILLVTSAMHMPRSLLIFKKLGITAIPAPTDFNATYAEEPSSLEATLLSILPDADYLRQSNRALKEYLGIFIYWLRGWV